MTSTNEVVDATKMYIKVTKTEIEYVPFEILKTLYGGGWQHKVVIRYLIENMITPNTVSMKKLLDTIDHNDLPMLGVMRVGATHYRRYTGYVC